MKRLPTYLLEIWLWMGLGIAVGLGFGLFLSAFVAALDMRPLYGTMLVGACAFVPFGIALVAGRTLEKRARIAEQRRLWSDKTW